MQVEMVGTPRGVPLACSRGASGALCSSGTPMNAQLCVSAVAVVSRRGGGRLASRTRARRRLRREEMKKGHGRAMNGSVSRMRAPVLFVRASTRVARVEVVDGVFRAHASPKKLV